MITVDGALLLSCWIKIEFICRKFLFASACGLGAETDLPEADEVEALKPLHLCTLPRPCKDPQLQLYMIIVFL